MSTLTLVLIVLVYFVATAVGVVTGGNSLITVPVLFQAGIDPKVAIATNMFGLLFMSIGASIPFFREGKIDVRKLCPLIALTVVASAIGAAIIGSVRSEIVPIVVAVSMIVVVSFIFFGPLKRERSRVRLVPALALTFALGIYGGLYSGGYMTMLTAVFVAFLGMGITEAIAGTKLVNAFSSLVATIVFIWQGLVDFRLGTILAVTMFFAAFVGAKTVLLLDEIWLKRIFLGIVVLLAIKTIADVFS